MLRRKVLISLAVMAVLATLAGHAGALPRVRRYISLSVSPTQLDPAQVEVPGEPAPLQDLQVSLYSNCNHGGVLVSVLSLQDEQGNPIPASRVEVRPQGAAEFLPLTEPVSVFAANGPGAGTVTLELRILTEESDPAGTYSGTLQLTTVVGEQTWGTLERQVEFTADVSRFVSLALQDAKAYVHVANVLEAGPDDLTLTPTGSVYTNAGIFVGLDLTPSPHITEPSLETDGGLLTGRIFGAMAGSVDVLGRDISAERFDVRILLSTGDGLRPPAYFGPSPDGLKDGTIWWLLGQGAQGEFPLQWQIDLLPAPAQDDGNYQFQADVVLTPML